MILLRFCLRTLHFMIDCAAAPIYAYMYLGIVDNNSTPCKYTMIKESHQYYIIAEWAARSASNYKTMKAYSSCPSR